MLVGDLNAAISDLLMMKGIEKRNGEIQKRQVRDLLKKLFIAAIMDQSITDLILDVIKFGKELHVNPLLWHALSKA